MAISLLIFVCGCRKHRHPRWSFRYHCPPSKWPFHYAGCYQNGHFNGWQYWVPRRNGHFYMVQIGSVIESCWRQLCHYTNKAPPTLPKSSHVLTDDNKICEENETTTQAKLPPASTDKDCMTPKASKPMRPLKGNTQPILPTMPTPKKRKAKGTPKGTPRSDNFKKLKAAKQASDALAKKRQDKQANSMKESLESLSRLPRKVCKYYCGFPGEARSRCRTFGWMRYKTE